MKHLFRLFNFMALSKELKQGQESIILVRNSTFGNFKLRLKINRTYQRIPSRKFEAYYKRPRTYTAFLFFFLAIERQRERERERAVNGVF